MVTPVRLLRHKKLTISAGRNGYAQAVRNRVVVRAAFTERPLGSAHRRQRVTRLVKAGGPLQGESFVPFPGPRVPAFTGGGGGPRKTGRAVETFSAPLGTSPLPWRAHGRGDWPAPQACETCRRAPEYC